MEINYFQFFFEVKTHKLKPIETNNLLNLSILKGNAKHAKLKKFFNCQFTPLIGSADDTPILLSMPPPQLHLLLSVNTILDCLVELWPELKDWIASLHIVYEVYHGFCLEGNECHKEDTN